MACKQRKNEKELPNLLKKSLGFHFSLINIIPMIALAVKKGERNSELCIGPMICNLTLERSQTSMAVVSFPLTYNRHCAEWHNQWKRSKRIRGKHSQFSQHQQKQSTPPCLGFEVGSGVFGACQPDVAVFLEKKIKAKKLWHAWCFLMWDEYLLHDTHLEVECNTDNKMPKNS